MQTLMNKFEIFQKWIITFNKFSFLSIYWPTNHRNTKTWQINLEHIAITASQNKFKLTQFFQMSFRFSKSFDLNILFANSI